MNQQVPLNRFMSGTRPFEPRRRTLEDAVADAKAAMEHVRTHGRYRGYYTSGTSPQIRRLIDRMVGERPDPNEETIHEIVSAFYRRWMESLEPKNELEAEFERACRAFGVYLPLGQGPLMVELVKRGYRPDRDFEQLLESAVDALRIYDEDERHAAKHFLGKDFGARGQEKLRIQREGLQVPLVPLLVYEVEQEINMGEIPFAPLAA